MEVKPFQPKVWAELEEKVSKMSKYVVVELRTNTYKYRYTLYLIDMQKEKLIDREEFGEIGSEFKPFIVAFNNLMRRNGLTHDDVKYVTIFNQKITNDEWRKLVDIALRGE